jgi:alkylation response protein AidB-like acyl-CoA dehydrogenase
VDFELTDDQEELQAVVREITERECPPSLLRSVIDGKDDDRRLWDTYVGLDWPGLTIAEADGGIGLTAVEQVVTLEELGRVADPTPYFGTTSLFAPLVREMASPQQRGELLGALCQGSTGAAAFATSEVTASRTDDGWTLHGTARCVIDGDRADQIAVVADGPDGPLAVVVPASAVSAQRLTTFDPTLHAADVTFDGVRVTPAQTLASGREDAVARAREEAVAGLAAMTVGAAQRVFELALDHIRSRHQFGVPIGSFQAIKHMAVDVYVALNRARALVQFAGLAIAEDDPRRTLAASMAKAAAGDAQRLAVKHGVQFFGGLGYTWENDLHLYVRRAKAGELLLGSTHEHRTIVARCALATHAAEAVR